MNQAPPHPSQDPEPQKPNTTKASVSTKHPPIPMASKVKSTVDVTRKDDAKNQDHTFQQPQQTKEAKHAPLSAKKRQQIQQQNAEGSGSNKKHVELVRQRLNISSPSKKKAGQHGFSQSDELMQYKTQKTVLRDFQIISKLGDGAYSSVFKVRRLEDGLIYALKKVKIGMMSNKDKENAINEVRILSSITNPNVVAYKEAFIDNETQTLNLIMQLADGGDLLKMISDRKRRKVHFRESQVWRVLIETVYGLRAMHDLSVMHRDIKSANIFLFRNTTEEQTQGGNLYQSKLGDMNVSKVTQSNGLNYTQTGTPYYASPEVWKDEPYGFKSDVWSLGCVIYEMLSLKPPFSGRDMDHLYKRVCKGVYPRIPEHYSNDIWAIVQQMLQVKPEQRPDCNMLISSKMFQIYTEKLTSLESVDRTFQKTLKSSSPDRAEIKVITNSLLTQLHLPTNDISQLSGILPRRNYESAQAVQQKGGSLVKSTSLQGVDEDISSNSRRLSKRNQRQNSSRQQRTQMNQNSVPETLQTRIDSATEQEESLRDNKNQKHAIQAKIRASAKRSRAIQQSVSPSPKIAKMTKIQSKLQRQYLQNQGAANSNSNSSLVQDGGLASSEQVNRSLNPTIITNHSRSKESTILRLNYPNEPEIVDGANTLRNRLNSKRKQVYRPSNVVRENAESPMDRQVYQSKHGTEKKSASVVMGSLHGRHPDASQNNSVERNGQNISPFKLEDAQQSPLNAQNTLKHARLSLPHVGGINRDSSLPSNSMAERVNPQTPVHSNSAVLALQLHSLPQLSEVDSDKHSQIRSRKHAEEYNSASLKAQLIGVDVSSIPSVIKGTTTNNSQSIYNTGSSVGKIRQFVDEQQSRPDENSEANYRAHKRHASFDQLVQPNGNNIASQIFLSKQGAIVNPMMQQNMPPQLIASQNVLAPSELGPTSNSTRMPESQSYSQINVLNKAQLGIVNGKGKVSTSDIDDQTMSLPAANLKHQLRHRINVVPQAHSSQNNNTMLSSFKNRISQGRPSIQSQVHEPTIFNKNQQNSVRHQQSDANFSLNSDELRHGAFKYGHLNGGINMHGQIGSQESLINTSQRQIEVLKNGGMIKLPQIDSRKKSLDSRHIRENHIVAKLSQSLKDSGISTIPKKKPIGAKQQAAAYYSVIQQSAIVPASNQSINTNVSLAQTLGNNTAASNRNMASLQSLGQGSPMNALYDVTLKNQSNTVKGPAQAIKKKTLAAYANSRARNPRNNLIYTQKSNAQQQP